MATASDATFATMASNISNIQTGSTGNEDIVLIGSFSDNTNKLNTRTVSDMSKYNFIAITFTELSSNALVNSGSANYCIQLLVPYTEFKKGAQYNSCCAGGPEKSMSSYSTFMQYKSNTTIDLQKGLATTRTWYIYGIGRK